MPKATHEPNTPTRRLALRFGATAALSGLLTPSIASAAPQVQAAARAGGPAGALVAITRRFRIAEDLANHLDEVWIRTPRATSAKDEAYTAFAEAENALDEPHESVFYHRPETLADAAVLAGHALENAVDISHCDLEWMVRTGQMEEVIEQIQNALAGILDVVSTASGLPVSEIGWRDLPRRQATILARVGGRA